MDIQAIMDKFSKKETFEKENMNVYIEKTEVSL